MPVDARTRALLNMLNRIEAPHLHDQPVELARHNFQKLMFAYRGEPPEDVVVQDLTLARRELEGGPLQARLYRPEAAGEQPLPALLWLHGGGWTLGDLASYEVLCCSLAKEAGCAVLALDYRLAPENPFPAAVEDVWFALRYLAREADALGLDAARLAVGGDSAGGNLAAVSCLMARDVGGIGKRASLCMQLLIYPATDQTSTRMSHETYGEGYFLDRSALAWFQHNYLPAESDKLDWRASPLLAPDLRALPPALILTAECDPLRDDAYAYAARLKEAGNQVNYSEYQGAIHGFFAMPRLLPSAVKAMAEVAQALREAFTS